MTLEACDGDSGSFDIPAHATLAVRASGRDLGVPGVEKPGKGMKCLLQAAAICKALKKSGILSVSTVT